MSEPDPPPPPTEPDAPRSGEADTPPSADPLEDTLSPSVRRLVRQYGLDVTAIRGTGPEGRIRVGDVMAAIGGEPALRGVASPAGATAPAGDASPKRADETRPVPMTCVFECDLGRVLAHRKAGRSRGEGYALTSYFVRACAEALPLLGGPDATRTIGVVVTGRNGSVVATTLTDAAGRPFDSLNAAIARLESSAPDDSRDAAAADSGSAEPARSPEDGSAPAVVVHQHSASGSLLTLPIPLEPGQLATLGVGKVRRLVAVGTLEETQAPHVSVQCYLSLTVDAGKVGYPLAHRFLGECVRRLERWPQDLSTAAIESAT